MSLEQHLILNRYMLDQLGCASFEDLKSGVEHLQEGPKGDGASYWLGGLYRADAKLDEAVLTEYDRRVMQREAELRRARGQFNFKYFQYLAVLFTEIYLDQLTRDPPCLLRVLNAFLHSLKLADMPDFTAADLRKLAFFMATGSGKTLLMHVHIRQALHYLAHGAHPEALVTPQKGDRAEFAHVLLVTPGEGLTAQHLNEFSLSQIPAVHLSVALNNPYAYAEHVKVIEIHKLTDTKNGEGVSIPLAELGSHNLVLVDEGHKGSGSEERTWKMRQQAISKDGMLLEYSATFAQAIAAAGRSKRKALVAEYGKSILFDYSYRYFYQDGYGKDFNVLNLSDARETEANKLLMGGLLLFYQQWRDYQNNREAAKVRNLAMPLWVFIGASVKGVYAKAGQKTSDIANIVAFLHRLLADQAGAEAVMRTLLAGESGYTDENGQDVFAPFLQTLTGVTSAEIYEDICRSLLGGQGDLEVWEIKGADGELGLKVSAPSAGKSAYFGLINIGDVSAFKKHLHEQLGMDVQEDRFSGSPFAGIEREDSPLRMLIGAKKFIEGWSSWRVSCMGLLNMGKSEGSQVIQLFGRGVRLKGRGMSLKRSAGGVADWVKQLETLFIFGWNGDYIARFKKMIEAEGVVKAFDAPVQHQTLLPGGLLIPQPRKGYSAMRETWALDATGSQVTLDLRPKVATMTGEHARGGMVQGESIRLSERLNQLNLKQLYLSLLDYKQMRGYGNLFVRKSNIPALLGQCKVILPHGYRLQDAAIQALRTYMDRFYARQEREAESRNLAVVALSEKHAPGSDLLIRQYTVTVSKKDLIDEVRKLVASADFANEREAPPIPRLHIDFHLYHPLIWSNEKKSEPPKLKQGIAVSPPPLNKGEAALVKAIRNYWRWHHHEHTDTEIYMLRNLPHVGVSLFHRSGFYPDFLLWITQGKGKQRLVFLEPHGMRQETQGLQCDKLAAIHKLRAQNSSPIFSKHKMTLDGYIITDTPAEGIHEGIEGMSREKLAKDYALMMVGDSWQVDDWSVKQALWG